MGWMVECFVDLKICIQSPLSIMPLYLMRKIFGPGKKSLKVRILTLYLTRPWKKFAFKNRQNVDFTRTWKKFVFKNDKILNRMSLIVLCFWAFPPNFTQIQTKKTRCLEAKHVYFVENERLGHNPTIRISDFNLPGRHCCQNTNSLSYATLYLMRIFFGPFIA